MFHPSLKMPSPFSESFPPNVRGVQLVLFAPSRFTQSFLWGAFGVQLVDIIDGTGRVCF